MASLTERPVAPVRAPRGTELSCKGWPQEAALRMLMNNLDPDVAERWEDLVVYGGSGKAARSWEAYHTIVRTLRRLGGDETLLVQSGKPVGVFKTHPDAPRVLIANALLVPEWGDWEHFRRYEAMGLTMYGQMTAGSWIYIGTQGILQGTFETFGACARKHFGGSLAGRLVLSAGLGGMGGAQPLAVTMNGGGGLLLEGDRQRLRPPVPPPCRAPRAPRPWGAGGGAGPFPPAGGGEGGAPPPPAAAGTGGGGLSAEVDRGRTDRRPRPGYAAGVPSPRGGAPRGPEGAGGRREPLSIAV